MPSTGSTTPTRAVPGKSAPSRSRPHRKRTTNPAARFTSVPRIAEPAAAAGETPARWASTPMAPIDHSLPGTYRPRLDTVQIRVASPKARWSPQALTSARQLATRSA
jgi:hypothetical protein